MPRTVECKNCTRKYDITVTSHCPQCKSNKIKYIRGRAYNSVPKILSQLK